MTAFTLDTSGEIVLPYPHLHPWPRGYRWEDLTPFTQGAVRAAIAGIPGPFVGIWTPDRGPGFSDLAPETLARIMEDCERAKATLDSYPGRPDLEERQGREFWASRQTEGPHHWANAVVRYPHVTLYLADDGMIYLKETT